MSIEKKQDELKELDQKIESWRKKMLEVGLEKGLCHPETVKISQDLDQLLNQRSCWR